MMGISKKSPLIYTNLNKKEDKAMIDLTKISLEEANKIECALLMLKNEIKAEIRALDKASTYEDLSLKSRETIKSNANWWREVYALIFESETR